MSDELKKKRLELIKRIVCIVLVVIFLPLLLVNIVLIVKGLVNPNVPPDIFGYMPLAVLSGSMDDGSENCIKVNDMIFVKKVDPQTLKEGDIITFDYSGDVVTHRIKDVIQVDGKIVSFETKGDANNTSDGLISVDKVFGVYQSRIGGLGGFIIFLQEPMGMLIFAGIPIAIFVILEVMSYMNNKKKVVSATVLDEKDAEIERLRALIEQNDEDDDDELDELDELEEVDDLEDLDEPEETDKPTENNDPQQTTENK